MKKLILFDLDGVLVDAKKIHFESLNKAFFKVGEKYVISESEHLSIFDGLKTYEKLQILTNIKNLDKKHYESIWSDKQNFTLNEIDKLQLDQNLINLFKFLKNNNHKVGCCSNSIKKSVISMLSKIGVIDYMDLILSNEDVKNPKPHAEIYWKAMSEFSLSPEDTLIIEDSPYGLLAAQRSGASIVRVKNSKDLTLEKIQSTKL
jgi:HAD superfamily hydrolase (TIGR01509 family)